MIRLPYAAINHPEVVIIAKPTSKKAWTTFLDPACFTGPGIPRVVDHGSQLVVAIHVGLVLFGDHLATTERLRRVATAATMLFQLSWWLPTNDCPGRNQRLGRWVPLWRMI